MYVYVRMYVCACVRVYVCMYVSTYVGTYAPYLYCVTHLFLLDDIAGLILQYYPGSTRTRTAAYYCCYSNDSKGRGTQWRRDGGWAPSQPPPRSHPWGQSNLLRSWVSQTHRLRTGRCRGCWSEWVCTQVGSWSGLCWSEGWQTKSGVVVLMREGWQTEKEASKLCVLN